MSNKWLTINCMSILYPIQGLFGTCDLFVIYCKRMYTRTHKRARARTHTHTHRYACTHARTHTHTHTHPHTHTHTHTHTPHTPHTHTHAHTTHTTHTPQHVNDTLILHVMESMDTGLQRTALSCHVRGLPTYRSLTSLSSARSATNIGDCLARDLLCLCVFVA